VSAPSGTPKDVIDTLNQGINTGLADPAIKARLANLGATEMSGSPADFTKLIDTETERWAKVVKFAHIQAN
jgi:tripartite-type tricarboxylate transporter receptor subunit TctC